MECPFKHSLDDVKECNMYKLGFCIYGPNCRYKHTKQPGEQPRYLTFFRVVLAPRMAAMWGGSEFLWYTLG
jgi:hypothetical protein